LLPLLLLLLLMSISTVAAAAAVAAVAAVTTADHHANNNSALDFLKKNKVNALRVPVALSTVLNPLQKIPLSKCVECKGGLTVDLLSKLITGCAARGIFVLLDMHYITPAVSHSAYLAFTAGTPLLLQWSVSVCYKG
jgi:Flp pilus assembly protein TadB